MWQNVVGSSRRGIGFLFCEECLGQLCMSSGNWSASFVASCVALVEEMTTSSSEGIAKGEMLCNWSYRLSTAGGTCSPETLRAAIGFCLTAGLHFLRYAIPIAASDFASSRAYILSFLEDVLLHDGELGLAEDSDGGRSGIDEGRLRLGRASWLQTSSSPSCTCLTLFRAPRRRPRCFDSPLSILTFFPSPALSVASGAADGLRFRECGLTDISVRPRRAGKERSRMLPPELRFGL